MFNKQHTPRCRRW